MIPLGKTGDRFAGVISSDIVPDFSLHAKKTGASSGLFLLY